MSEQNDNTQQTPVPPLPPKPVTPPPPPAQKVHSFGCSNCGADLKYKPGTKNLTCEYCNAENEIPEIGEKEVEELDYFKQLEIQSDDSNTISLNIINCEVCGAESTLEDDIASANCPYCTTPLVLNNAHIEAVIQPRSLLPFALNHNDSNDKFGKWISKLWFAPNALKKSEKKLDSLKGLYLPFWTYDADTVTPYTGKKGVTTGSSKNRKTTWYKAKGTIYRNFDDVLVAATDTLTDKNIKELANWDLKSLTPFEPSFLSGFTTLKYQVGLEDRFSKAVDIMDEGIQQSIRHDIGGDKQKITWYKPSYSNITFKHILLPVYISAYKYKDKVYRVIINGSTGKISGERPYSAIKIILFIIMLGIIGYLCYELFWFIDGKMQTL